MTQVEIGCWLDVNGEKFDWCRRRKDEQSSQTTIDKRNIGRYAQEITNDISKELPLFCFQSEARAWR